MPIKLLHHKSWHVWKRDNIAKVKRDEAEHAQKEKERKRKEKAAQGEVQLQSLKRGEATSKEHVNFFEEEQKGVGGNAEFEKELKNKKERELRKQGLAPLGLGESASKKEFKPWYTFSESEAKPVRGLGGRNLSVEKGKGRLARERTRIEQSDPLLQINRFVEDTKWFNREDSTRKDDFKGDERRSRKRKHRKEKKSKKHKKKKHRRD